MMDSPELSNRLPHLAATATATLSIMRRSATEVASLAIAVGHTLIEAKALVRHGEWEAWLSANLQMSGRTARGYMQLARCGIKTATVADLGIRHALRVAARPPRLIFGPHEHHGQPVWFGQCKAGVVLIAPWLDRYHVVLLDAEGFVCTRRPVDEQDLPVQLGEMGVRGMLRLRDAGSQIALGWVHGIVRGEAIDSPEMEARFENHRRWCEALAKGTTATWQPVEVAS